MAIEIERKYLLASEQWRAEVSRSQRMAQAYFANTETASMRVRIAGERAWLNIKGMTIGASRPEYEYEIPLADAEEQLTLCMPGQIDKTRHYVERDGLVWEIDEFHGDNSGLIVAEVELESEEQSITKPDWLGSEVTGDARYYNVMLAKTPYSQWP